MDAAEMHAMEKAALEDPFLADAIEGFDSTKKEYDNDAINNDLIQLRNQIAEKANTGKVRAIASFRWWRVAAAAIVLIVFGAVTYNYWLKPEVNDQLIVVNDNKPATVDPSATQAETTITHEKDTLFKKDISESYEEANKPRTETEKKLDNQIAKAPDREIASAPPVDLKESSQVSSNVTKTADAEDFAAVKPGRFKNKNDSIDTDSALARSQKLVEYEPQRKSTVADDDQFFANSDKKAKSKSPGKADPGLTKGNAGAANASLNYFNGRVTDINNRPIANATVQLSNTRNGYTTDQYGNFRIPKHR